MSGFELPPLIGSPTRPSSQPRLIGEEVGPRPRPTGEEVAGPAFAEALAGQLEQVAALRHQVTEETKAMAMGKPIGADQLMLSIGKSEVAFNLMLEVRNKLLDAWEKLSRSVV